MSSSSSASSTAVFAPNSFSGKKVFVSGSTSGIGFACASTFASLGAQVWINGRTKEKCDQAIERLRSSVTLPASAQLTALPADLSDAEQTSKALAQLPQDLDILVCNTGIFNESKKFEEITDEIWMKYFNVNVMTTVRLARHFFPLMLKANKHGRIVVMSSMSAIKSSSSMPHYSMSKAAQLAIASSMAQQTKGTTVTVNSVMPGLVDSEVVDQELRSNAEKKGMSKEEFCQKHVFSGEDSSSLIKRLIKPQEVANVVCFLAGEGAGPINGAAMRVEGGALRNMI